VDGAKLLSSLAEGTKGDFRFEYSPETFSGTEPEYALAVCNAVLDVWKPTPAHKVIINLPSTIEYAMPHVFASQIEYMHKNLKYRDSVVISVHPHNDRGSGVCDAEMSLLAGADRIEGTLFGNGERTGNADIVTLAMNMFSQGVDPQLDFTDMPSIVERYQNFTGMTVGERQPYSGSLVFAAFSGSHQDAIAKGFSYRKQHPDAKWNLPYLLIDPEDIGREYDADVIRINSQSGKGGVAYILERSFGLQLPKKMKENMGYAAKNVSDRLHKELLPEELLSIFNDRYMNNRPIFDIAEVHYVQADGIIAKVSISKPGAAEAITVESAGNGRLDAVSNALKKHLDVQYQIDCYEEHALSEGSNAKAMAYVGVKCDKGYYWGAGSDDDIIKASVNALVSAINALVDSER
jgi:2-isopropylmalate synthase